MSKMSTQALDLQGKIALVTGGGTGIGLMIAKELSKNGAKVYITGRRLEVLQKTAAETGLFPLQMDVSDKQSIANGVKVIDEAEGKLDILVNNAGIGGFRSELFFGKPAPDGTKIGEALFEQDSFEQWTDVFKTNTAGPYFTTMGFLSLLERGTRTREGETSSVIIISSVGGTIKVTSGLIAYPVSKAGVNHLTGMLATQFALQKIPIRVNCIAPGIFPSELARELADVAMEPMPGFFNPAPPLRPGRQLEIGSAAVFLSSLAGEFVNGIIMPVDGGLLLVNP
ncbi:hypothetical protein D9758_017572 [Tetrapyrgos nigripes]|uniref:Uncharacterized protein n=1 Tax=Tetrapyrgos nigripes TaxID=182062 RepID=A0A8H5C3J9_9AGAR|nr:hypothetical protein D9758_017663 [Tetrapyrgos nigripes]KAF5338684.1 hypothetical protein D9758_017572 [Tetrapyrgos nigripes]